MVRGLSIVLLAAACGRVGFDSATDGGGSGDGNGDGQNGDGSFVEDAPGSLIDDVFIAGETTMLVIDRGMSGAYVNAAGTLVYAGPAEPRFDHDPITHEPLGLLLESTAIQEAHMTEQLDDGAEWFSNGAMGVTANAAVAPDGAMTADSLVDTDAVLECRRAQSFVLPNDTNARTCSVFVKAGSISNISFGCEALGGSPQIQLRMSLDLAAGTIKAPPAGALAHGLEPAGNGWYRAWISYQNNGTGNTNGVLSLWSETGNDAATGSYLAWGAQLEVGPVPTSYIPNDTTTTKLRPKESARFFIPPLMIHNGSVRVVARPKYDVPTAAICVIANGSYRVCVMRDPTLDAMSIDVVGTSSANLAHGGWALGTERWGAFTYDYDMAAITAVSENGSSTATWSLPGVASQITLGNDMTTSGTVHLVRGTVWTSVISDTELSALSP